MTGSTYVGALADMWLEEIRDSGRATNTKERYQELVDRHVRPGLGSLRVEELSVGRLDRHLSVVRERAGETTAKAVRTVLKGVIGVAVRHDAIQVNPAGHTRPITPKRKPVDALTLEQVIALREAVRHDAPAVDADLPDLVDLMLGTGCRINEALALRWSRVNLAAPVPEVTIDATATRTKGVGLVIQEHPKTRAGHRTLMLPGFVVEMMLRRQVEQPSNAPNVVFPSSTGTLRDSRNVSRQWRALQRRDPRWGHVTSHTFRKTVATVIARNFDALTASEQLGHASSAVTESHYIERAHRGPDARKMLESFAASLAESDG
ncbi:putative Phage integrase family protein [metagenome]|uniref:Putative Phage integrase family protein n=1 Tax=metagenome TaxID=256318 RepID=A0A2P2CJJ1_9ZZZZ